MKCQNGLYRTWQSVGERLQREFQWQAKDELLNGEIFYTLKEAQVIIDQWRRHYNHVRPHSSLGYRPLEPHVIISHEPYSTTFHTLHDLNH